MLVKHQSTRTLLHENDPVGNIIDNFADLFNLSVDTKTSKTGITDEIKKDVGTTLLKIALYFRSQNCTSCNQTNKWRNRAFCHLFRKYIDQRHSFCPNAAKNNWVFVFWAQNGPYNVRPHDLKKKKLVLLLLKINYRACSPKAIHFHRSTVALMNRDDCLCTCTVEKLHYSPLSHFERKLASEHCLCR